MTRVVLLAFILCSPVLLFSQAENISVRHPVYDLLNRFETSGYLENESLNDLPWDKQRIVDALQLAGKKTTNKSDLKLIRAFLVEFEAIGPETAVVFPSGTDSNSIFWRDFFSHKEKFVYYYSDSNHTARLEPLASSDLMYNSEEINGGNSALITNLGFRLSGSLDSSLGFNLQVTNGVLAAGEREIANLENRYSKNVKFTAFESDVDITESHVNYRNDWFYAGIGRETRLIGSGLDNYMITSDNSPAFDAITFGAKFRKFEYKFMHASLIGFYESVGEWTAGYSIVIPEKYMAMHRFSVRPSWGEFSFWETVIYSERGPDAAYLNPLSFFKSLEHALRDRDNSGMGMDITVRPFSRFQVKGSFFLDDIRFEQIGTGYWSNKTALNIAGMYSFKSGLDAGLEYSRTEPYTFTHFNRQNSMINDGRMIGHSLPPNSDRVTAVLKFWPGTRYPVKLKIAKTRHGKNVYDSEGNLKKNVGGDPTITIRPGDPTVVTFLDGKREDTFSAEASWGFEIVRNLNLFAIYRYADIDSDSRHYFRLLVRINEF